MPDPLIEYPSEDLEAMSAGKNYSQWIHSFFSPYVKGKVAEVGAGIGAYSKVLLNPPSLERLTVFEPSVRLFELLKLAVDESEGYVEFRNDYFSPGSCCYDTIIYINVLEHIEDDQGELRKVYEGMCESGKLLIFVPALPFLFSENDHRVGHFRRYRKKDLAVKVENAGFRILQLRYFDSIGVFSWFLCCKLMKMNPSASSVGIYDRLFVPFLHIMEHFIPPFIGKNLILVAEKM